MFPVISQLGNEWEMCKPALYQCLSAIMRKKCGFSTKKPTASWNHNFLNDIMSLKMRKINLILLTISKCHEILQCDKTMSFFVINAYKPRYINIVKNE